ncbi:MAG: lipid IV(A) 3-deoxy-D-manno-octulosonic acid transferase [Gammaproteobacteria bacterium]|nr:lipid IV(A) 3-deoxy-D-manno-octulosonic acid transferase [Gammaproteobacteria bacterium]
MLRFAYALITYLLIPVVLGHLWWRSLSNPAYRRRIGERFGYFDRRLDSRSIWIHAVSVGEVQAAAALVSALQSRYPDAPIVMTTMTPTGSQQAQDLFGDTVVHSYVPYDLASAVRRFFDWARPSLVIIMETELWPNLFRECGRRKIPLVLASARVSARSVRRYRRLLSLFRETLSHGVVIAAQTETDAARFLSLGANPARIHVTGNIKFDFYLGPETTAGGRDFRRTHAAGRPVWIAASTHGDEEQIVLTAHHKVLLENGNALLLLVPRHPERFQFVGSLLERAGMSCVTRSSGDRCMPETNVFLGDSMGELTLFYAAADVAFVGGSLTPVGGHNLLEPAALGMPVLTGPYTFNAADIAELLIDNGSTQIVHDADELADRVTALFADQRERQRRGSAGREVIENNRGTLQRLLDLIGPLIAPASR